MTATPRTAKCSRCGAPIPHNPLRQHLPHYCPACAMKVYEENARKIAAIKGDTDVRK